MQSTARVNFQIRLCDDDTSSLFAEILCANVSIVSHAARSSFGVDDGGRDERVRRLDRWHADAIRTRIDQCATCVHLSLSLFFSYSHLSSSIDVLESLKALVIPWAGVSDPTRKLLLEHFPSLPVHNIHHNAVTVAELTLTLMLCCAKSVLTLHRTMADGRWLPGHRDESLPPIFALHGKRVLVVGYGAVGREIARRCEAFGMRVVATRRSTLARTIVDQSVELWPQSALDDLLGDVDVLVLAVPLTDQTRSMIGERQLSRMKSTAIVINVGRGPGRCFWLTNDWTMTGSLRVQ